MATFIVPAPEVEEYQHGLVDSANRVSGSLYGFDEQEGEQVLRWADGVGVNFFGHIIINGVCTSCASPATKSAEQAACQSAVTFYPYLLEFGIYETMGARGRAEIQQVGETAMRIGTSAKLENLMVVGCTGMSTPKIADAAALSSAANVTAAVGKIIAYFYDSSQHTTGRGTIYMGPADFGNLGFDLVREDSNGVLRTKAGGHKVIVGNYAAGTVYGHVGDVDLYLSDIYTYEAGNSIYQTNVGHWRIERYGMAVWDTSRDVKVAIT